MKMRLLNEEEEAGSLVVEFRDPRMSPKEPVWLY